ncbi:MAG TPA: FecR domain-containing protein [Terriglobales bacterium]|nr:FecR domain-containing protein [Terriglobales bacterium]
MPPKSHSPKITIGWTTVTYRSVLLMILAVVVLFTISTYLVFPEPTKRVGTKLFDVTVGKLADVHQRAPVGNQTANFTLIDGTVKVKKANSNAWVTADYQTPLEKGDVIQTSSEGLAKVVFPDGTSYNIKQDSLIVIEENSANEQQQTETKVNLTSGTVDLSTGSYAQGSRSEVVVAGATASFSHDTSAMVRNDPKADQHEIMVKRGEGEVVRGVENVKLTEYEQVSFTSQAPKMTKEKQIAPPTLISPANMLPIFIVDPKDPVQFSWSPVNHAVSYHLRVSRNPYFSSTVIDKNVGTSDTQITNLGEGAFYWMVQSEDINGQTSIESEKNRFTVIRKGPDNVAIALELAPLVQRGRVIEIKGKTEATARVMVNGQEVPAVGTDGSFQYFTPPLPNGENLITITAQNSKGGVKTLQKKVVIQ